MENNDNVEYQKPKTMKGKRRKPKVEAGEIIEKVVPHEEVVQEVSYSKAREMKEKRPMRSSEKQKQNIDKLILLNAERKKERDAEKKRVLEEEEQRKKVVVVKTVVREKRPYIRRQDRTTSTMQERRSKAST
jgi:hypothetical protein